MHIPHMAALLAANPHLKDRQAVHLRLVQGRADCGRNVNCQGLAPLGYPA